MDLKIIGQNAKNAYKNLSKLNSNEKNLILEKCIENLNKYKEEILKANEEDVKIAKENGIKEILIDRLILNEDRINSMCNGINQIKELKDPIGEYIYAETLSNGLKVCKKRVPIGVIGMIYESRPNVTVDGFSICFKASSAVILKGGKESINTNKAIVKYLRQSIKELGYDENFVQLIEDTKRETTMNMMKMNDYINLLIPRGSAGLIKAVLENSTLPVIETGVGNCHIFIDETADFNKALKIVLNAKVQRPSVCNSAETLLIHKNIANEILPILIDVLLKNGVEIRADEKAKEIILNEKIKLACEKDWEEEFLDYILAIKVVENIDEAILHIGKYSTG
ncbi:MAG: glutamate-5-semialdehyde dehydrogenase, partial [Eubacteriales bacterium]|nr:glutamate-5-semialdehyde dehydrogenase [Eubacteriales bacterium]